MKTIGLVLALSAMLIACTEKQDDVAFEAAKQAVTGKLKDPSSVQFRYLRKYRDGDETTVCGELNAKNGFGGYVGFKPFAAAGGEAWIDLDPKSYDEVCSNASLR